ncbi:CTLH/CRA C-terminal to lish motif domain-containing protein [Cytidiella melzeri]|nr:CTLH/CRA C-terminal to lish motif domain-containing protein [Cytidiella melzeri]
MPLSKRQKIDEKKPEEELNNSGEEEEADASVASGSEQADSEGDASADTDDEIADTKWAKSKKTLKRKHRATDATRFGSALQSLLNTDAPSTLPLSLKPSINRKRNDEKLEAKGKKVIQVERKEKEEKGRIKDVIGGWGGESERALRKVAQRGVVKLFNVIQQSQTTAAAAEEGLKAQRGTGKPTLPAPSLATKDVKKGKLKPNALGQGKDSVVGENDFLNSIRLGGIPPKVVIRQEEWERRLHDLQVSKNDLNRLVMDYLVIEGFKSAAEEFSHEAGLAAPVDLESIESRMNIREALQRGDVSEAITRVNDLDPEILDTNPALYFRLQQQKLIEYIRQGKIAEALEFAQEELAPRGEESPEFLAELEKTMALLAFESSPSAPPAIAELLSPAQRLKTAGEVNAAILESLSQGKDAKLVGLLKLLCWGETMLDERAEFPKLDLGEGTFTQSTAQTKHG